MPVTFAQDLAAWGPGTSAKCVSLPEAERYCRDLATRHYENFPVVSWCLPKPLRQHFSNIYAFCRWSDDLADEVHDLSAHPGQTQVERALALLGWWKGELKICYAGQAEHPVFVALKETIREFSIPAEPFEDLISAFEQDQIVRDYATFAELVDYCRRSANPVGRLVLYLCRRAQPENFAWSDSVCTGLQLANFWQDVSRDLDIGRVYLPREDRERFGYTDTDLQARVTNPQFLELLKFEVDRARTFLLPRDPGRGELRSFPFRLQLAVDLFARGGLCILDRIERLGYRVWDRRPKVTKWDVLGMSAAAIGSALIRPLRSNKRQPR